MPALRRWHGRLHFPCGEMSSLTTPVTADLATYWTIAGDVVPLGPPEREASAIDFRTRVEAAHHAGYRGLGLIHSDLMHVRRQYDFASMRAILADNDMRHLEFEFLTGWRTVRLDRPPTPCSPISVKPPRSARGI
jgi:hypothetical protein